MHHADPALQAAYDELAAATPAPGMAGRRRRPVAGPQRIARRYVPRHSLAITLDTSISQGARNCLAYLLSLPRAGFILPSVSAGLIASAFQNSTRTAYRWLQQLEGADYLVVRQGSRRGQLVLLLSPKATRWCQLREGDFQAEQKTPEPAIPQPCASSLPIRAASKGTKEDKKEGALEGAAVDKPAAPITAERVARARQRAKELEGTTTGAFMWQVYLDTLARFRAQGASAGS